MAANVPPAPHFTRRVHTVEELQLAIADAVRAANIAPDDLLFDGSVRLEANEPTSGAVSPFVLTILKRNRSHESRTFCRRVEQ